MVRKPTHGTEKMGSCTSRPAIRVKLMSSTGSVLKSWLDHEGSKGVVLSERLKCSLPGSCEWLVCLLKRLKKCMKKYHTWMEIRIIHRVVTPFFDMTRFVSSISWGGTLEIPSLKWTSKNPQQKRRLEECHPESLVGSGHHFYEFHGG